MHRVVLFCLLILTAAFSAQAYDYPFTNPYEATVFGTLPQDEFDLASVRPAGFSDLNPLRDLGAVRGREMLLHDRPVPEILWYDDTLQYTLAQQRGNAPLMFILAGTGSSHESATCSFLQRVFHRAGFHVVTLSSPTYPNFVVSASTTQVPGYIPYDVADLYQAMDAIAAQMGRDRITSFHLAGYSLGGTQAAFLAELDTREKRFGFEKVLLLNPAVNLMTSAIRLDHLLSDNVADRFEAARTVAELVRQLSEAYRSSDQVNFGDEFLFALHRNRSISEKELKILIGVAFRLSLASMVFTSDTCTGAGYIVPRGHRIVKDESLAPYLDSAVGVSFEDYVREYLLPFLRFHDPAITAEKAVAACSLEAIGPFLRGAGGIAVMTNADDPILTPENFAFLENTFGSRLTVFPAGGHCGNLRFRDNVAAMLDFFRK
ncbi:alpha/beta fold hydrolase [Desulfomicrobium escambiense]|uniref:alpha/beta fold hydrolase n=1 Tax=Desulfomicrobium escambiense TaxID=29503 RepID=UPI0004261AA9|nr:alpha/beta fold hydrolase [Desulfomicrobium escambiense]